MTLVRFKHSKLMNSSISISNFLRRANQGGGRAFDIVNAFASRVSSDGGSIEATNCLTNRIQELIDNGLWDIASAAWTAHAQKVGKFYAVKGGSIGDVALVRTSPKTRKTASGTIGTLAQNEPAIDYTLGNCPSLSVEGAGQNLFLNSETLSTQGVSVTAQAYTVSFYGTGTITFSGAYSGSLVGTGSNTRVKIIFTPTAGTLTCTVSGTVTKAQIEPNTYETSYIATTASSGVRAADVYGGLTGVSSLIGQTAGTFYFDGVPRASSSHRNVLSLNDGSTNNRFEVLFRSTNAAQAVLVVGGVLVADITSGTLSNDTRHKIAATYTGTRVALFADGNLIGERSIASLPASLTNMRITARSDGGTPFIGYGTTWVLSKTAISDAMAIANTVV